MSGLLTLPTACLSPLMSGLPPLILWGAVTVVAVEAVGIGGGLDNVASSVTAMSSYLAIRQVPRWQPFQVSSGSTAIKLQWHSAKKSCAATRTVKKHLTLQFDLA